MSAQVINLNKFRKAAKKAKQSALAQENSVKFGRTKGQKELEKSLAEKASKELDGKKSDP